MSEGPLLEVRNLEKHYPVTAGVFSREVGRVQAVDGVSFDIQNGETLGLVGESGCGKTTVGRTLLRLEEPTGGEVLFEGQNLAEASRNELRQLRRNIQMVFQDPMSSLNPRMTIRDIVGEPLAVHKIAKGEDLDARVISLLEKVGIPAAWRNRYPHEFSGGQRQRVGIARALALGPKLIVCDEAVSALDVSVQAQVLNLLIDLRPELGLSYLFISHDLSVVRHVSDRIAVMYLGQIVEQASAEQLFERALHPYTRALLSAIPIPDPTREIQRIVLQGDVPSPISPPSGCRFHTRCPAVMDRCRRDIPPNVTLSDGHQVRCFLVETGLPGGFQMVETRRQRAEAKNREQGQGTQQDRPFLRREARETFEPDKAPPTLALGVILALMLMSVLYWAWPGSAGTQAQDQVAGLQREISAYQEAIGEFPEVLDDMGWRLREIFPSGKSVDPWGGSWRYERTGESFSLRSPGPDGEVGTDDDLEVAAG